MNRTLRIAALCASIMLAACSGDTGTQNPNNDKADTGVGDTGEKPDTGGVDKDDVGSPQDVGADALRVDAGADADSGSPADAGMDAMADAMADMGRPYPDVGEYPCYFPSTDPACPAADFGPGSFLELFQIETKSGVDACCRDFTGDGSVDNVIGETIISLAASIGGVDVNQNIERAITLGRLVYLVELQDVSNDQFDSDVKVSILTGTDTDFDMQPNLLGEGEFYVSEDSYDASGEANWGFDDGYIYEGELHASGGELRIFFPGLVEAVDLWLTDVELKADVTPGADLGGGGSVELQNGELSGALLRDRFFSSMNEVANSPTCACLNQDILEYRAVRNDWVCLLAPVPGEQYVNPCGPQTEEACQLLGDLQLCSTFSFASSRADLDVDGDGRRDAYSFGARFRGTTTVLKTNTP